MNNGYIMDSTYKQERSQGQCLKELRGMSPSQQQRIMKEIQKIHDAEFAEEKQFFDRIARVFEAFSHRGFSDEASIQLTIAFLNDPIFQKKRGKRKTISEIIEKFKE